VHLSAFGQAAGNVMGEWWLDEFAWTGAANEVLDSSANARHGTSVAPAGTTIGYTCWAGDLST
jgi:hypothetical protein